MILAGGRSAADHHDESAAPRVDHPIEQALHHRFTRTELLQQALTHGSAAGLGSTRRRSTGRAARPVAKATGYERLEFLGDRVLGLVVADMLWHRFPDEAEGDLAKRFVQLVRQEALCEVARILAIAEHVHVATGALTDAVLSDVLEALIGALYLDGGLPAASRFIARHWEARVDAAITPPRDPKTALQEWVQGRSLPLPSYSLVATSGPPHKPTFTVSVTIGNLPAATAEGSSKRQAEVKAAAVLLKRIKP